MAYILPLIMCIRFVFIIEIVVGVLFTGSKYSSLASTLLCDRVGSVHTSDPIHIYIYLHMLNYIHYRYINISTYNCIYAIGNWAFILCRYINIFLYSYFYKVVCNII